MLNWQQETDYLFVAALDGAGLAWEFLRRNTTYILNYETLQNSDPAQSERLGRIPVLSNDSGLTTGFYYAPPKDDGESEKEWALRVDEPRRFTLESHLCHEWGLEGELRDPRNNSAPIFTRADKLPSAIKFEGISSFYQNDGESFPPVDDKVLIGFDLSIPFGPQLNKAKDILNEIGKPKKPGKGSQLENMPVYLRLLDAPDSITAKEMVPYFKKLQILSQVDDPYAANKQVNEWKTRAKMLTENYRAFL